MFSSMFGFGEPHRAIDGCSCSTCAYSRAATRERNTHKSAIFDAAADAISSEGHIFVAAPLDPRTLKERYLAGRMEPRGVNAMTLKAGLGPSTAVPNN